MAAADELSTASDRHQSVKSARQQGWTEELTRLEARLGGRDRERWPEGWQAPEDSGPPRVGVVAASLAGGGYRRGANGEPSTGAADLEAAGQGCAPSPTLAHRADERFPAASTMKVFVLQALLEAAAEGTRDLAEKRALSGDDAVSGSGVLKLLTPGTELSLLDLATLMITVSDNTATNMLIDALGIEAIRRSAAEHGWHDTYLRGKLQLAPVVAGSKSSPSQTSPRDLADYFSRLWSGELLPTELTETAKQIYRRQQFTELGRSLDYDSYSAEIGVSEMSIASKSGSIRGVRNDAGVVEYWDRDDTGDDRAPGAPLESYVVVVMTDGCPDRRFHADNLGALVVGEVAALSLARLRGG